MVRKIAAAVVFEVDSGRGAKELNHIEGGRLAAALFRRGNRKARRDLEGVERVSMEYP